MEKMAKLGDILVTKVRKILLIQKKAVPLRAQYFGVK